LLIGGAEQTDSSPALIAGLAAHVAGTPTPLHSATVCVGPPLFVSAAGSKLGLVLSKDP
jgi:hypothetical protein